MPFVLAIIGVMLMISAIQGTTGTLFSLLKSDFTGSDNFVLWIVAIMIVGSIGYIKKIQPISDAFLALILVVLFLSNKGFFAQFMTAIQNPVQATASTSSSTNGSAISVPLTDILSNAGASASQIGAALNSNALSNSSIGGGTGAPF